MDSQTLIFILAGLTILSAFFSASETAFSSANKIRLKYLANNGNKRAQEVLRLVEDYTSLLSCVLIGNNIVNTVSASLATLLFVNLFGQSGVGYASIVMTIVLLIFGEITPKTIAKEMPEHYAMSVAPVFSFLIFILRPINFVFEKWKYLLSHLFQAEDSESFRSEEFITMVEEAQEGGDMDDHEADLLTNAIEFKDMDVKDILTPRVDVVAAEVDMDYDIIEKKFRENGFSRLPVYEKTVDNIIGFIHEKDFYYLYYKQTKMSIREVLKPVIFTSPHVKISALLRQLQHDKTHMAVVIDEYGGTAGIITMEDILEELVGEIYDEHDQVIEYFQKISDTEYYVKGDADIDDAFEYFDIEPDDEYDFNTVSAWVIHNLDKIPKNGDSFVFQNLEVTVMEADAKRVLKVKVKIRKDEKDN